MAGNLFLGEAEGHLSGAGTLAIYSQQNPALTCQGEFTSSAELGGKGQLRCSDGTTSTFKFTRLTLRRGHGSGNFGRGSMSFSYGLTADEARLPQAARRAKLEAERDKLRLSARSSLTSMEQWACRSRSGGSCPTAT